MSIGAFATKINVILMVNFLYTIFESERFSVINGIKEILHILWVFLLFFSIDQLTEVVHHHIETGAKLKNELVLVSNDFFLIYIYHILINYSRRIWHFHHFPYSIHQECSDFYLNGDCRVVTSPLPPPRPPPLEKPMRSTPTIAQLELLYQQLYSISPSGANWRDKLWCGAINSTVMSVS